MSPNCTPTVPKVCAMERFLKWATELGISDFTTNPTTVPSRLQIPHCCVGHSLCVSHFPHAGGYFHFHSPFFSSFDSRKSTKKKKKLNDVNFFFLFFLFPWSGFLLFLCLIYSRGLAAARDLSQGELILTVPKSALMTSQSLLKDEKLSVAVKRHTSLSSPQVFHNKLLFWTLFGCPENVGILEKNKHAPLNWA